MFHKNQLVKDRNLRGERRLTAALLLCVFVSTVDHIAVGQNADLASQVEQRPPNIVLLIGDDHGWPYYGFMGSKLVETPHLDRLAREGVLFRFGHTTSSVCRPSLLTLLTGLYPLQYYQQIDAMADDQLSDRSVGSLDRQQNPWGLFSSELQRRRFSMAMQHFETLPRRLATKGYASFEGGKYWEGDCKDAGFTAGMSGQWNTGLLENYGLLYALAGGDGLVLGRETMHPVFDFIDQNRSRPFFVWYAPMLPHTPLNPPERLLKSYQQRGLSDQAAKYFANCTWFDEGVGELIDFLDKRHLRENTLIVYVNDNGWEQPLTEDATTPQVRMLGGDHGKNSLHDFGFRTPLIVNWPGNVPTGAERETMFSTVDLYPTLLDYAGLQAPEGLPGETLRPAIEGGDTSGREYLIGSMHQLRGENGWQPFAATGYYLRTRRWHYIECPSRGIEELYDMTSDPDATTNVVDGHREKAKAFHQLIAAWRDQTVGHTKPDHKE